MDNWSKCPRCESNRVQKISKWAAFLAMFGSAGCLIWVGIFFPPLWFAVPVLIIVAFVMLLGKDMWKCQDCKHSWAVKKVKDAQPIVAQEPRIDIARYEKKRKEGNSNK